MALLTILKRRQQLQVHRSVQWAAVLSLVRISSSTVQCRSGKAERKLAIKLFEPDPVIWHSPGGQIHDAIRSQQIIESGKIVLVDDHIKDAADRVPG